MTPHTERGRFRASLASVPLLAVVVLASGCIIEENHHGGHLIVRPSIPPVPQCPSQSTTAENQTIDVNDTESVQSDPGQGAGVLVDYDAGGHWHVWSVCDTALSGISCGFAVTALALGGDPVTNVTGDDLEAGETAGTVCADTAFFAASTDFGIDGVRFDATPGAAVQIEAALDGTVFADIISFAQGGVAVASKTNPITLTPASP